MTDSTSFHTLSAEEVAKLLPNYSKITFHAQGGMAAIYRGIQTALERPVAIKLLPREMSSDDSFRLRFIAEGKAMARLNHPNLVSIFDFGEADGLLYLVMEFVEGNTLHDELHAGNIDDVRAVQLCQQVSEGLAHAHQNNILHRDIKPANVLIDPHGVPKLGDFGLAEEDKRAEGDDLVFGTPGYTAPEILANPADADERGDIYAMGALLHELLTGHAPITPYSPPSRSGRGNLFIDSLLVKALDANPNTRPQTAQNLSQELTKLVSKTRSSTPPQARPTPQLQTSGGGNEAKRTLVTPAASGPPQPAATPRPAKTGINFALFRNLIIIAALLGAIYLALQAVKNKQDKNEALNKENETKQELTESRQDAARIGQERASQQTTTPIVDDTPEPITKRVDDRPSLEQLADLKSSLSKGKRSEFPTATLLHQREHYLFIETPMSWQQACLFAEEHGANLPVLEKKNALKWLSNQIPGHGEVWIGAGSISRDKWAWTSPSVPFTSDIPSTSLGTAAALDSLGLLKARKPGKKLPFFINWGPKLRKHRNIVNLVNKFGKQLSKGNANELSWPAGTLAYLDRRYYIVPNKSTFEEASIFAKENGGHLAVASDKREAYFLQDLIEDVALEQCWIGGEVNNGAWQWTSTEDWEVELWNPTSKQDPTSGNALAMTQKGFASIPSETATNFIIEWSLDSPLSGSILKNALFPDEPKEPKVTATSQESSNDELLELQTKAYQLVTAEINELNKLCKNNFTLQGMSLRQWERGLTGSRASTSREVMANYNTLVEDETTTLPSPEDFKENLLSLDLEVPERFASELDRFYELQLELENKTDEKIENLRIAFVQKVSDLLVKAQDEGHSEEASKLTQEFSKIGQDAASFKQYALSQH